MGSPHGRKPPNPRHVPKQHGRKPPPPPPRTGRNMGKSSASAAAPVVGVAFMLFIFLPLVVVGGVVGYVVFG